MNPLVVVGDALLDRDVEGSVERLSPDAPVPVLDESHTTTRPGGAALAAVLAASDGREVTLITALSRDDCACELRTLLSDAGVDVVDLGLHAPTPEKIRIRTGAQAIMRLDRGGGTPADVGSASAATRAAIGWASAVLVADYGRGVAAQDGVRAALESRGDGQPLVWDPHPRGPDPIPGASIVTPNRDEAVRFAPHVDGHGLAAVTAMAEALVGRWQARSVCVTRGGDGALIAFADARDCALAIPAPISSAAADPCGAGDRFASRAAQALADGMAVEAAVSEAVAAASGWVAAGGAARCWTAAGLDLGFGPLAERQSDAAEQLAARVRANGGTVVATGGCFDLLHAGHVATLTAARRLGDCLIVCVNSDASVRRLKGPDRPLVAAEDRAAVLNALACVDEVAIFDEDTPVPLLERLRPHLFAKGGDYRVADLPEARALEAWDGSAVTLPFVAGRSTTRLIEEAMQRGTG
ncbi:MAG: D-beta-D-heptose 7-phosphate kinase / D-beta-D-heptose 1-phosphate adenosyltransferase [Thermoleophilales bacterium]|nr:D-beta-D-heptose 7-phosphate kinase / D-beta-D-heptose 1-phosphate adenosyltransferase [Thermoleophilales bacterium]